jgi:DNA anti-recombination protein RmuC
MKEEAAGVPPLSSSTSSQTTSTVTSLPTFAICCAAIAGGAAVHFAARGRTRQQQHFLALMETLTRQQDLQRTMQSEMSVLRDYVSHLPSSQQQLEGINKDLSELREIFIGPNRIGKFGEFRLETLIEKCMSPKSLGLYDFQSKLSNNKVVDCILHFPSPIGNLAVDSKFPLQTFQELLDNEQDKDAAKKLVQTMQGHIEDIASKYIIPGETADHAIMFLPSEALFLKVATDFPEEIVHHAQRKRVYIASPTTLAILLAQLHGTARGFTLEQKAGEVLSCVQKMGKDVDRLVRQFEATKKSLDKSKTELNNMEKSVEQFRRLKLTLDDLGEFVATARPDKVKDDSARADSGVSENVQDREIVSSIGAPTNPYDNGNAADRDIK